MKDNLYIRNDKDGESRKLPNVILYSDTENSFAIRTNMGSHKGIDRVFNKTYDKKMAKCLYSYLNRLYNGFIFIKLNLRTICDNIIRAILDFGGAI